MNRAALAPGHQVLPSGVAMIAAGTGAGLIGDGMRRPITILAVAIAAGVAGIAAPGTATAGTTADWHLDFQAVHAYGLFRSIAAISGTNVWAVADLYGGRAGRVYAPYIRHFDGHSWEAVKIRGARMTSDFVQATAPDDVWVFGLTPNSVHMTASGAYRWDGKHWRKVPVPRYTYLQGVVALGPSNVWAFGSSDTSPGDVFHWNGRKWRSYNLNFSPQFISGSSARNVWLTGLARAGKKDKAAAYQWSGSRWRSVRTPHPIVDFGPGVTAITRSNVWIGWDTATTAKAARWDGRRWTEVTAPGNVEANGYDIIPDAHHGYWFGPFADWTGNAWRSALISPEEPAGSFGGIVQIPRTESFLMAAGVANTPASTQHPTIYRLNLK